MSFAIHLLKGGEGDEANKREERVRKQSVTKSTCNVQKTIRIWGTVHATTRTPDRSTKSSTNDQQHKNNSFGWERVKPQKKNR